MTPRVMSEAEKAREELKEWWRGPRYSADLYVLVDRAILLARLETAEKMFTIAADGYDKGTSGWWYDLRAERDRLRAEVEKHGK